MKTPLLIGCKGCGNTIVEAAFALARLPCALEEADYSDDSPTRERIFKLNPLGQVPILVLPGGEVMTESAAMIHYIDARAPGAGLVPGANDPKRMRFYRWLVFLVAAVYPTYTYGDDPKKWVKDDAGAKLLREATDRHRERLWSFLDSEAGSPWFLGDERSALDLYCAVMTRWRPGRKWFAANAPKIMAIAERTAALPEIAPVIERNF